MGVCSSQGAAGGAVGCTSASWRGRDTAASSQAAAGAHLGGLLGADSDGQADVCCAFAWLKKMKWKQVR